MPLRKTCLWILSFLLCGGTVAAQKADPPDSQNGTVIGTVLDVNGGVVPDASVSLQGGGDPRTETTNANGFFAFHGLRPGVPYRIAASAPGFAAWTSTPVILSPGQFYVAPSIRLRLSTVQIVVKALTPEEVATEEVHAEEKQRILGVVPNFYVAYDPRAVPLTSRLKFQLAFKALIDPVTIAGFALNAGFYQLGHYPWYQQGLKGYGQRLGATFAGGYTNVLVGDAFLPVVFHQDPRYFYLGSGTKRARLIHALSNAFVARGDNGRQEVNYSGILGSIASGAVANTYYPSAERGGGLVLRSALIGTAGRMINGVIQEFVLRKATRGSPPNGSAGLLSGH